MFKYIWILLVLAGLKVQADIFLDETGECRDLLESADMYALLINKGPEEIDLINSPDLKDSILERADSIDSSKLAAGSKLSVWNIGRKIANKYWLLVFHKEEGQMINPQFHEIYHIKREYFRGEPFVITLKCEFLSDQWDVQPVSYPGKPWKSLFSLSEEEFINKIGVSKLPKLSQLALAGVTKKVIQPYLNHIKENLYNVKARLDITFNRPEELIFLNESCINDVHDYESYINKYKKQLKSLAKDKNSLLDILHNDIDKFIANANSEIQTLETLLPLYLSLKTTNECLNTKIPYLNELKDKINTPHSSLESLFSSYNNYDLYQRDVVEYNNHIDECIEPLIKLKLNHETSVDINKSIDNYINIIKKHNNLSDREKGAFYFVDPNTLKEDGEINRCFKVLTGKEHNVSIKIYSDGTGNQYVSPIQLRDAIFSICGYSKRINIIVFGKLFLSNENGIRPNSYYALNKPNDYFFDNGALTVLKGSL